jgi:hypothetical protein
LGTLFAQERWNGIGLLSRNVGVLLHALWLAGGHDAGPAPCRGKLQRGDLLE